MLLGMVEGHILQGDYSGQCLFFLVKLNKWIFYAFSNTNLKKIISFPIQKKNQMDQNHA